MNPGGAAPGQPWSAATVKRAVLAGEYRIRAESEGDGFLAVNRAADLRARWSRDGLSAWRARQSTSPARPADIRLNAVALGRGAAGSTDLKARALGGRPFALGACRSDGARDEHGQCLKRLERDSGRAVGMVGEPRRRSGPWLPRRAGARAGAGLAAGEGAGPGGAHRGRAIPGKGAILVGQRHRFRYGGLAAWGADGQTLATRMRRAGNQLLLEVDDQGARYPVVVDPVLTVHPWSYQSNQLTPVPD